MWSNVTFLSIKIGDLAALEDKYLLLRTVQQLLRDEAYLSSESSNFKRV